MDLIVIISYGFISLIYIFIASGLVILSVVSLIQTVKTNRVIK